MLTLSTIPEVEEVWSSEVEDALMEALRMYYDHPKFAEINGRKFGRNKLIADHIKKRCGKTRTPKQIASHIQVLKKWQKNKSSSFMAIQDPILSNHLLAPSVYCNELLTLLESGSTVFLKTKETKQGQHYFTDIEDLISNMYEILPYRKISSEKLAFCSMLTYAHDKNADTNSIIRGFTCLSGMDIHSISRYDVFHYFGDDLIDLYNKVHSDSIYLVKSYINLNAPKIENNDSIDFVWSQTFYSHLNMDIEMSATVYIFGEPLYNLVMDHLATYETFIENMKYYIYHLNLPHDHPFVINFIGTFIKEVQKLENLGYSDVIKTVTKNQARLVMLREKHSREILMVLACIHDYLPNFAGYQFYKIV